MDSLFQLINQLSASEKRYFKIFVNASNKKDTNKYLELFETISKQKKYDEQEVVQKLNHEKNLNNFSSSKNYLFQLILKSLRNYHSASLDNNNVLELLRDVELLYQKKLYKSCYKTLQKIQKIVVDDNYLEYQIIVNSWELKVAKYISSTSDYWFNVENILGRTNSAAEELLSNIVFQTQATKAESHNIIHGISKTGDALHEFHQLALHPILQDFENAKTDRSKIFYHLFYIHYYIGLRDLEQQLLWNKKLMQLFEAHPQFKIDHLELFLQAQALYVFNLLELRGYPAFLQELEKFHKIEISKSSLNLIDFRTSEYLYMKSYFYTMTGQFDKIIRELKEPIEFYYNEMKGKMHSKNEVWMVGNLSWAYLGMGKLSEANHWVNQTLDLIDKNILVDIYIIFKSMEIVIHYQLKNPSIVDSLAKSLERYIISKNKMNAMEAFNLRFFKKAAVLFHDRAQQKELLKELKKDVNMISKLDLEKSIFQFDRVLFWIESQLRNKTLSELVRERQKLSQ